MGEAGAGKALQNCGAPLLADRHAAPGPAGQSNEQERYLTATGNIDLVIARRALCRPGRLAVGGRLSSVPAREGREGEGGCGWACAWAWASQRGSGPARAYRSPTAASASGASGARTPQTANTQGRACGVACARGPRLGFSSSPSRPI